MAYDDRCAALAVSQAAAQAQLDVLVATLAEIELAGNKPSKRFKSTVSRQQKLVKQLNDDMRKCDQTGLRKDPENVSYRTDASSEWADATGRSFEAAGDALSAYFGAPGGTARAPNVPRVPPTPQDTAPDDNRLPAPLDFMTYGQAALAGGGIIAAVALTAAFAR